jgi:hypothetical protein
VRHVLIGEPSDWPAELREAREKVRRGVEHLSSFKGAHAAFLETQPYRVAVAFEHECGCHVARIQIVEQPPLRLSTIIGDVVHNFRSALDFIAWQLALRHSRNLANKHRSSISFPLTTRPGCFETHKAVQFFSPTAQAVLKGLQPRSDLGPDDKRFFLRPLSVLSNADKHRALTTSFAALDFTNVGWRPGYIDVSTASDFSVEMFIKRGDTFGDGTKVAYLHFAGLTDDPYMFNVDVTRQPTANVLFGDEGFGPNALVGFLDAANLVFCEVLPLFE